MAEILHSYQTRFVVEYETDGEGTLTSRSFLHLRSARSFARAVTDPERGPIAWPSEALLYRETSQDGGAWEVDAELRETYIDGRRE